MRDLTPLNAILHSLGTAMSDAYAATCLALRPLQTDNIGTVRTSWREGANFGVMRCMVAAEDKFGVPAQAEGTAVW
jgi:hypothetical protein